MAHQPGPFARFLGGIWGGLNLVRKVFFNVVVLFAIAILLAVAFRDTTPSVPAKAALILNPKGTLVEQFEGDAEQRAINRLTGGGTVETHVRDVLDAIRIAKEDDRISSLLLDLNSLSGGGLTKLQQIGRALDDFKISGKTVVAVADNYERTGYFLAAHADEVYLHEFGAALIEGFARYRMYYKNALDRLEVDWQVFRVGTFKSAVEPYLREDMSPAAREANLEWMGDLWDAYVVDIAQARKLSPEELRAKIDNFDVLAVEADGHLGQVAVDMGLVDKLVNRQFVRDRMIELVGHDEEEKSFSRIGFSDYLEANADKREPDQKDERVAVIVAKGSIVDGTAPQGTIGGDSVASLIRQARGDDKVKAVVLRVDSGGGSAFASEIIRQEFEWTQAAGKPVVVSMGSVAASGGYWISTSADEIWASPTTITGSIGIFGMFPTYDRGMRKYLGLAVDGVGTTPLAGALRPDRPMNPRAASVIQANIELGYRNFLERVSRARGMTTEQVDKIAQGRVWSGIDAQELGLVDHLGEIGQAIESAAKLAKLEDYSVVYVEKESSWSEKFLTDLGVRAALLVGWSPSPSSFPGERFVQMFQRELRRLEQFNDPLGVYAHCFCEIE